MGISIETIKTPSFEMDYFRFGQGRKPFVIIPGLSILSVTTFAAAVASAYRVFGNDYTAYVLDRRKNLPDSYSIADIARDTAEAMEALGLKETYLFGASQGGMIAQLIAIEYPQLVKKLVLGSTTSHAHAGEYPVIENWVRLAKEGDPEALYLDFGEKIYSEESMEKFRGALIAAAGMVTEQDMARFIILAESMQGFDVRERLCEIKCPVLLLGAEDDRVLNGEATREIAAHLRARADDAAPAVELHMHTGYGHASFDLAPDYKDRLLRFFGD